jgi:hypothetical protein
VIGMMRACAVKARAASAIDRHRVGVDVAAHGHGAAVIA